MKFLFTFWLALLTTIAMSQNPAYSPSQSQLPSKKQLEDRLELQLEKDITALPSGSKRVKDIYENRAEYILLMASKEDEYIFNSPANQYINTVFEILLKANPQFNSEQVALYLSRNMAPNMSSFGEGTIVLNIGLLRRLENESQVAFVLAHELAHLQLNHINQEIIAPSKVKANIAMQKEIERITKLNYKHNETGQQLLSGTPYNSSRHSNIHEVETDDLALEIMANAGYAVKEAPKVIENFKTINEPKYKANINIRNAFNRELYPFKEEWKHEKNNLAAFFEKESVGKLFNYDEKFLFTHPNLDERQTNLNSKLGNFEAGKIAQQPQQNHDAAVQQADFDFVLSNYQYGNYGQTIYQSLQLQELYPEHPFLTGIIGATMGEMVELIDDHELGKYLPHSSPEFSDNYNELLSFLNNLSMKDMMEVGYNYVRIYQGQAAENAALAYGLTLTTSIKEKKNERDTNKDIYYKNYPDAYFTKKMRTIR